MAIFALKISLSQQKSNPKETIPEPILKQRQHRYENHFFCEVDPEVQAAIDAAKEAQAAAAKAGSVFWSNVKASNIWVTSESCGYDSTPNLNPHASLVGPKDYDFIQVLEPPGLRPD